MRAIVYMGLTGFHYPTSVQVIYDSSRRQPYSVWCTFSGPRDRPVWFDETLAGCYKAMGFPVETREVRTIR